MKNQGIQAVAESIQFFALAMMGLLWTGVMACIVGLVIYGIIQGEVIGTLGFVVLGVLFVLWGVAFTLWVRKS